MQLNLKGATVLDIGANKGIYCFWMIRAVGTSGRVIAFEPQPEMCKSIEQKKALFGWKGLQILNVALSNADGEKSLFKKGLAMVAPRWKRPGVVTQI